MRWVLVSKASATLQEYDLVDNEECKVILKYNPIHQSVRVSSDGHQRLFYLESAGSLSGKTIFKNEYGMEIGSLSSEKQQHEGSVLIDKKKYHYHLQNGPLDEFVIYDSNLKQALMSCKLSNAQATSSNNTTIMLLGLCWYLSLAIAKETAVEYAA